MRLFKEKRKGCYIWNTKKLSVKINTWLIFKNFKEIKIKCH